MSGRDDLDPVDQGGGATARDVVQVLEDQSADLRASVGGCAAQDGGRRLLLHLVSPAGGRAGGWPPGEGAGGRPPPRDTPAGGRAPPRRRRGKQRGRGGVRGGSAGRAQGSFLFGGSTPPAPEWTAGVDLMLSPPAAQA